MKREKNDIHTNTTQLSTVFKLMRSSLKLLGRIAPGLAVTLVTRLFRKPIRKKVRKKQRTFYDSGTTDHLKIRDYDIKIFKKGTGPVVLVTHGWGSYGYDMKHFVTILVREGYQVILPDLPCHGRSSGKRTDQIEVAKVMEALLRHYNAQSPIRHIVTHSWGGTVTLLALDRIRKSEHKNFKIHSMVSVSMPANFNAITDIFCRVLELSETVKNGFMKNLQRIAAREKISPEDAFPMRLESLLARPQFHYLLIHGKKDRAVPHTNSIQLAAKFPQLQLQLKDDLGHIDILADATVHNEIIHHLKPCSSNRNQ